MTVMWVISILEPQQQVFGNCAYVTCQNDKILKKKLGENLVTFTDLLILPEPLQPKAVWGTQPTCLSTFPNATAAYQMRNQQSLQPSDFPKSRPPFLPASDFSCHPGVLEVPSVPSKAPPPRYHPSPPPRPSQAPQDPQHP